MAAAALAAPAQAQDWSAQLRARGEHRSANHLGPLTGTQGSALNLEVDLRGQWRGLNGALALRQEQGGEADEKRSSSSSATLNELYANADLGAWQLSAGRKLLSWDVGYAFRPNDMVAQEERRTLLSSQVRGRPLLAAEHFDADTAWSLVWVNPLKQEGRRGDEQALAGRVYRRQGSLDLHGFARWGQHSGPSLGAALAWVAMDALELHASLRLARRDHALLNQPDSNSQLQRQSPWREGLRGSHAQALLGLSWTGESRLSLLAEAWWDGNALSPQDWRDWQRRTQQLRALPPGAAVPPQALAANLAWQAQAFGSGSSLQRSNVFLRLSWSENGWSPALDCLYHPADGGRIWTASLAWQGDRLRVDAGLRHYGGPADAVLAQLPQRRQGYAAISWAF